MKPINSVPEKEEKMWSKGLPKVEGDYYTRVDATDDNPSLIRVEGRGAVYEFSGVNLHSVHESVTWEYLGPISPSDTEELLALRGQLNNAADLEMLARDEINALREAAEAALPLLDLYRGMIQPSTWAESASVAEVIAQLRKALGKE